MISPPDPSQPNPGENASRQKLLGIIDELRATERQLRQREAMLELKGTIARIGSWNFELSDRSLTWSETTYVLHEVEHRRPPTVEEAVAFYHPEDRPRIAAAVEQALAEGKEFDGEFRIITAKGRERWVRSMGRLFIENGRPARLGGIFQDIDAHKRAALALAEAETRWRFALDGAGHGVWDWRVDTGEIYFSAQGKALLGYTGDELAGTIDAWKARAHPDDLPAAETALLAHFAGRSDLYTCEHRMRCKDGSWKWILARGRVTEWNAPGQPRRMIGTHTDIDELRRVQAELRASEARFRQLFDFAPDSIFLVSAEPEDRGRILDANEPAARQHGYTRAELRGMRITELDDARSALEAPERIRRILHDGVFSFEVMHRRKDGTLFPVEVTAAVVEIGGRKVIQSINRDITARREAQAKEREIRDRLGLALKAADLGVFRRNLRTGAGEWNARTWEIYGRPARPAAPSDAEHAEMLVPEDRPEFLRLRESAAALGAGANVRHRFRIRRPDGTVRHLEAHALIVCGADGRAEWMVGTTSDQTETLRQTEALAASERLRNAASRRLQLTLEATGIGTWRHNFRTGEAEWDENTCRLFGFERTPAYPDLFERVLPEDRPWMETTWAALAQGQRTFKGQFRARRPDGTVVHVQSQGFLETDAEGRPEWVTGINLDITQRVEAERERRHLEAQLLHTQKMETLGNLAGGIAHDFNNLLTGILGFLDLARLDAEPGSPIASHIARARAAGLKSRDLVKRLLLFARRTPGAPKKPVHLPDVISETIALLTATLPSSISIRTEVASGLPKVLADESQLQQVLMNLCVNGGQAIGQRAGVIRIQLGAATTAGGATQLVLSVGDDGCGMDAATVARVFEPFFTTKQIGEGSGLGLAIVHGIVQDHGGSIDVASTPGEGTVFTVRLPAAPAEAAPPAPAADRRPVAIAGRGRRVLLVEDDEMVRDYVRSVLEGAGFVIEVCADGQAGSRRIAAGTGELDLAVLDLTMPGKSGLALLRELLQERTDLPVLVMSGDADRYGAGEWPDYPRLRRLAKPFMEGDFVAAVGELLDEPARR